MKITEIEKLNQLVSRADMTGNEKVDWLTDFIDKREEQLRIANVSGSYCMYCEKKLKPNEAIVICKDCAV